MRLTSASVLFCWLLAGGGSVAVQLMLYPRLVESLGVLRVFKLGTVLFAAASLLLPSSV